MDKPVGMTSHDVVSKMRRIYGLKRVGHAGTLDPEASGLLVVALGNITRLLDYFQAGTKTYEGDVVFGIETDSYDSSGTVVAQYEMDPISRERLDDAIATLLGEIMQFPPIVSALKVGGKRLYEYHRESKQVEIKPRKVRIDKLEYQIVNEYTARIRVICSPGTYIRSIAHDLGVYLGGGAHLRNLRRIASGSFNVSNANLIDELNLSSILSPSEALGWIETVSITGSTLSLARNGGKIEFADRDLEILIAYDGHNPEFETWNQIVGLYQRESPGVYKPTVILP